MENVGDAKKRKLNEEEELEAEYGNGNGGSMSKDELQGLLEPLTKEQLISIMLNIGSLNPAIAEEIRDVASKDPAHRKLFVRGLAWETSSQTLCAAFEQYGEIEEGAVIMDKNTGKSRGFGFVTFKHMDSAQRALKEPSKTIDGRITISNLAASSSSPGQNADLAQRKLYIGGLSYDTPNEKLLEVFSKYGEIEEGSVAYDKKTNKSRGFAFVTFKTVEAAKRALKEPNKNIDGRGVTVKLAAEGQKEKPTSQSAASPKMQPVPQIQAGYATDYANITSYQRPVPQVAASAPPVIGFSAYPSGLTAYAAQPLPYATQTTYAGISSTPQYGGLGPVTPYSSSQYAKYATSLQTPRLVQSGLHTAAPGAGTGASYPYYSSSGTNF
uniref:TSA: Wollemia nobilis Ref_Wollemi_Transcript_1845_1572 transcribed RNA sequence n=1 Tax=Wollemia nobilis TaxID=56998 RepID=A0A0C9QX59_9CONI